MELNKWFKSYGEYYRYYFANIGKLIDEGEYCIGIEYSIKNGNKSIDLWPNVSDDRFEYITMQWPIDRVETEHAVVEFIFTHERLFK